jgi:hypothetical protein
MDTRLFSRCFAVKPQVAEQKPEPQAGHCGPIDWTIVSSPEILKKFLLKKVLKKAHNRNL